MAVWDSACDRSEDWRLLRTSGVQNMGGRMVGVVEVEERKDVVHSFLFEAMGIEDLKAGNDTISFLF